MTPVPVHLRPGRTSDLDAILALDRATELAPHWPVSAYAAILNATDPERCLFVADLRAPTSTIAPTPTSLLAGFAVGLLHAAAQPSTADLAAPRTTEPDALRTAESEVPRIAELEDIVVASACRRSGIGRALLVSILEWTKQGRATEILLEVRAANAGAIALYASLGFTATGRRPRYYSNPDDDALTMHLLL